MFQHLRTSSVMPNWNPFGLVKIPAGVTLLFNNSRINTIKCQLLVKLRPRQSQNCYICRNCYIVVCAARTETERGPSESIFRERRGAVPSFTFLIWGALWRALYDPLDFFFVISADRNGVPAGNWAFASVAECQV